MEGVIPKGTCLAEWENPFLIVSLYSSTSTEERREGLSGGTMEEDPTDVFHPGSNNNNNPSPPRYQECAIWQQTKKRKQQQQHQNQTVSLSPSNDDHDASSSSCTGLWKLPQLRRFLQQKRPQQPLDDNQVSSSSAAYWNYLCLVATVELIDDDDEEQPQYHNIIIKRHGSENKTEEEDGMATASFLSSKTNNDSARMDVDDEELEAQQQLLMEAWPLLQVYVDWNTFQCLFGHVQSQLHMMTIPHPLQAYAQQTLFQLSDEEYQQSCISLATLQLQKNSRSKQRHNSRSATPTTHQQPQQESSLPIHRLRASQQWLDIVADLPPRIVGVLLHNPSSFHKAEGEPKPQLGSSLPQSCIPTTCLELKQNHRGAVLCRWISLYDLPEKDTATRTISTQPTPPKNCNCFQCHHRHRTKKTPSKQPHDDVALSLDEIPAAQRLAHSYFQNDKLEEALQLYQKCHDTILVQVSTTDGTEQAKQQCADRWMYLAADVWHSTGAVLLTQLEFAKAQVHWQKSACKYPDVHPEIREQLLKQQAYRYFSSVEESSSKSRSSNSCAKKFPSYSTLTAAVPNNTQVESTTASSIYLATNVIDEMTCGRLIGYAEEFAAAASQNDGAGDGWTTQRHYAVPTQDLPVHKVPNLLDWFQRWMDTTLFPLLSKQFGVLTEEEEDDDDDNNRRRRRRFYVHDAFLVRYQSTSSNHFLPLHYDESTHSCVVALNDDDFEGGGTYFYVLDQVVTPPTGGMVSFQGNRTLHGGSPVTKGIRYILAIFLYLDQDTRNVSDDDDDSKEPPTDTTGGGIKRTRSLGTSNDDTPFAFSFF